jgi:hypothetical protein
MYSKAKALRIEIEKNPNFFIFFMLKMHLQNFAVFWALFRRWRLLQLQTLFWQTVFIDKKTWRQGNIET